MIKKTKKEVIEKYKSGLSEMKKYNVVTQQQALKILGCHQTTLKSLVELGLLHEYKVSRVTLYSTSDKKYSNRQIRRSLLLAYSNLYIKYNFPLVQIDELSQGLIQQNVVYKGTYKNDDISYYEILDVSNLDYKKIIKLFDDIWLNSKSERVYITLIHNNPFFSSIDFQQVLDEDKITLKINNSIFFQAVNANFPHFRYIQL